MNNISITQNIINNLIEAMSLAVALSPHKESSMKELQGSLQYFTGCEFPFFNGVFNNYQGQNLAVRDNLSEIVEFFSEKNTPFIWWWLQESEMPQEIKKELDEKGFQFVGECSGVAVKLDKISLQYNPEIKIKLVENNDEYHTFMNIMSEVFQLSDSIKKDFTAMFQSYGLNGNFKHYLGFFKNEPVTTLTSYIKDNILGLYNGATLVKAQKKGMATATIQQAKKDGIDLKCEYAISQLVAPGMAQGLSEKLGAKKYCSLLPFLKTP